MGTEKRKRCFRSVETKTLPQPSHPCTPSRAEVSARTQTRAACQATHKHNAIGDARTNTHVTTKQQQTTSKRTHTPTPPGRTDTNTAERTRRRAAACRERNANTRPAAAGTTPARPEAKLAKGENSLKSRAGLTLRYASPPTHPQSGRRTNAKAPTLSAPRRRQNEQHGPEATVRCCQPTFSDPSPPLPLSGLARRGQERVV